MFGPTASPVVHRQSTWHIGPTTCVFTRAASRGARATDRRDDVEPRAHRRQLGVDPARERDRLGGVLADEARRPRDAVGEHVGADRAGGERAARHRRGQPALGVRERHVHGLGRAARLDDVAVVGELVRAELDLDRHRRHGDDRDADERLRGARERLEVDRRDEAVGRRPSPRGVRRSTAASFFRGQRMQSLRRSDGGDADAEGKPLAERIRAEVAEEVQGARADRPRDRARRRRPGVAVYIRLKHKAATEAGFEATDLRLPAETSEDELLAKLDELNADDEVDAMLVQLPLPDHIDEARVIRAIDPVEGRRRPPSVQRRRALPRPAALVVGDAASACMALLREHRVELDGARVGRDRAQRRSSASPCRRCCMQANATVTLCHSHTRDLARAHPRRRRARRRRRRPGARVTADMVKTGARRHRRRDEPHRRGARRRRRPAARRRSRRT